MWAQIRLFFTAVCPSGPAYIDCKRVRIFAYSSTREQSREKVSNKAENRERDWGEALKIRLLNALRACEARALRARETLKPRFTDFFTDFEKKTDCFAV